MDKRLALHNLLLSTGCNNVYFQQPSSANMSYPAIRYELSDILNKSAGDIIYSQSFFYSLTVIDYDPDSELVTAISKLPKVKFDRHYKTDNLNHYVFTIYY